MLAAAAFLPCCGTEPEVGRFRTSAESLLFVTDTIDLEENDSVIHVISVVEPDGSNGFLVADRREHQIRRINGNGRVEWNQGRRGEGPGEYNDPRIAIRLSVDSILAVESAGRFTIFSEARQEALGTSSTPFRRVEQATLVNDSVLLVSAILGDNFAGPRLHLWHIFQERILSSFFAPFERTPIRDAAVIGGFARFAVWGDTIAATWSLSDSIYWFSLADGSRRSSALRSSFRTPQADPPGAGASDREKAEWLGTFHYISGIWWLGPEHLGIQYFEIIPEEGMTRLYNLVVYSVRDGTAVESNDVPRVLTAIPETGELILLDPESEAPNRWLRASLRR